MNKSYVYGAMALGLLFTGCKSDDLPISPNEISTDSERTFYVNVCLHSDAIGNETRAAVDDGTPSEFERGESDIKEAYFVFYDKDGNQVGGEPVKVPLTNVTWTEATTANDPDPENPNPTIDKFYKSTVGVTIGNGQENPTQVICYLNPQIPDQLDEAPLNGTGGIQTQTRTNLYSDEGDNRYFSMSNSVYYPTTASEAPQIAVQIAPNQLFNSKAAADNAMNDASLTVNIYVERYAAKLSFKSVTPGDYTTKTNPIDGSTSDPVTLSFDAKKWMLNASCWETYVVKSFREESQTGDILADNYGYQELDDIINKNGGDWTWNAAQYKRSYWGMSPAYFTSEYPEVSSDVAGISTLNQHYYSYDELIGKEGTEETEAIVPVGYEVSTGEAVTEYVHETTVGSKALASRNIVAALPSVILVGDYTVTIGSQKHNDINFYTYSADEVTGKPFVYFEANKSSLIGASAITGGESMLRGLIKAATNLYKKVGNKYENFDLTDNEDIEKLVAVFEVTDPSPDVKGNLKVPERYRTLQIREGATADQLAGIYVGTTDGYKSINAVDQTPGLTEITTLQANQELMKVVGFAALYTAGAAYFNIPVRHFGWYRTTNTNNGAESIDWSKVRVGDFGVVRNHSYNIEVSKIVGLGTGIGGKDNPIVPPAEENRYYVAYSVSILQWAVVPTQTVEL